MRLDGWNVLPRGYSARFDTRAAPVWLRVLFSTPFLDRFAYPLLVRRGLAYLAPSPAVEAAERDPFPAGGWRLESPASVQPGSVSWLRADHGNEPQLGCDRWA